MLFYRENNSYENTYGSDEERDSIERREVKEKQQRHNFIKREFKKRKTVSLPDTINIQVNIII